MDERRELRGKEARVRLEELEERIRKSSERIRELQSEAVEAVGSAPDRALLAAVHAQNAIVNRNLAGWNLVRSLESSAAVHDRAADYFASVAQAHPREAAGYLEAAASHRRQAIEDRNRARSVQDRLGSFNGGPVPPADSSP